MVPADQCPINLEHAGDTVHSNSCIVPQVTTVIGVSSVTKYMKIFGIDTAAVNKVDFLLIFAGFLCEECVYMLLGDL